MLGGLIALLIAADRHSKFRALFQWLPIPLWCYGIPMLLRAVSWLPAHAPAYLWITDQVFPIALGLLLLGVDLSALARIGPKAGLAMGIGVAGIICGGPLMLWLFHGALPAKAWQGIGTLAATWTGGSLNMLALRTILDVPDGIFAPLVVVDALVAYSWMALLVASKGMEARLDRWLRATDVAVHSSAPVTGSVSRGSTPRIVWGCGLAIGLAVICRWLARPLPLGGLVASTTGWTILLVTTVSLLLSCLPAARRLGQDGGAVGYPCLYLVLAALGAQASLGALASTPVWILVGFGWVVFHAALLLLGGRLFRLPFGILATASQANVGGVVSAPLVGAVYDQTLAPVGLILAIAANAAGTYLGMLAATLARWVVGR